MFTMAFHFLYVIGFLVSPGKGGSDSYKATCEKVGGVVEPVQEYAQLVFSLTGHSTLLKPCKLTLDVNGKQRFGQLHIPDSHTPSVPLPLMLNFHAYFNTTAYAQIPTAFGLDPIYSSHVEWTGVLDGFGKVADKEGFFIFSIQRPLDSELPGFPQVDEATGFPAVTEVDVTLKFLEALAKLEYDTQRLYAVGMSAGGFVTFMHACLMGQRLAAIAVVAGFMGPFQYVEPLSAETVGVDNCFPGRAIPTLSIHGTGDNTVSYDGNLYEVNLGGVTGDVPRESKRLVGRMPDAPAVADFWAKNNGCEPAELLYSIGEIEVITTCPTETNVTLVTIKNGTHTWYGSRANALAGWSDTSGLKSTEAIWDFLKTKKLTSDHVTESPESSATSESASGAGHYRSMATTALGLFLCSNLLCNAFQLASS